MKILFVSSGNNNKGISSIVQQQGESLKNKDINIDFFRIVGKGLNGYLQNRKSLRVALKKEKYDLIHAHYSLSGFLVSLAFTKIPVLVSLMGSDIKMRGFWKIIVRINSLFFWKTVIVKSQKMKDELGLDKAIVVPNGVNLQKFKPTSSMAMKAQLGWCSQNKHI